MNLINISRDNISDNDSSSVIDEKLIKKMENFLIIKTLNVSPSSTDNTENYYGAWFFIVCVDWLQCGFD